ncbi:MAG: M18 family aminopeptidase [Gammaproteobacteria bacterium]|nr:M18 family aminopeptidase [Gammaproteobacteria bacterium]
MNPDPMLDDFNLELCQFLDASPTPFHAVEMMKAKLIQHNYKPLDERDNWGTLPAGRYFVTRNDSSIVAFNLPNQDLAEIGFRMVGAHTDSPCLQVKPQPEKCSHSLWQLGVEVYGGALLNPWFDRDLSMAGRVSYVDSDDQIQHTLINFKKPLAVIPSLAIHLDRDVNQSRSVNPQLHLPPIIFQGVDDQKFDFRELLRDQVLIDYPDCDITKVLDYEISLYDTQPAALTGLNKDFISSARLDNLLSCYVGLNALIHDDEHVANLLICSDHEEVGSMSTSGAQGSLLESVLMRLCSDIEQHHRMIQRSIMISADNAHAIHPNFADKHDAEHGPKLNHGPVIKTNANQRYATNSETSAFFRQLCQQLDVPVQDFVVRTDMACGSTIGPLTASALGVRTLDIGVPTFAMHSIRELAGSQDAYLLNKVLTRFYSNS